MNHEYSRIVRVTRKIVCLCGSTKFKQAYADAMLAESLLGNIVLTVSGMYHADSLPLDETQLAVVHDLHFSKIDLASEVLILNVGDYIGEQTEREIRYCINNNKPLRYLEPTKRVFNNQRLTS